MIKTPKPLCAYCSKPYGRNVEHIVSIFTPDDAANPTTVPMVPAYNGNGVVVKEWYSPSEKDWRNGDRSVEITRPNAVPDAVHSTHITLRHMLDNKNRTGRTLYRTIRTPGEYITPYAPFCTLRCGLQFGRSSHNAGYRIKKD